MASNKVAPVDQSSGGKLEEVGVAHEKPETASIGCSPTKMIDPDHKWRLRWDALLMTFIIYNAIFVPMTVAFGVAHFKALNPLDNVADTAFIIDLFLSFRTGFYVRDGADKVLVLDQVQVAARYIRGWMIIDVASIGIPYGLTDHLEADKTTKYILSLLALLKLLRLARLGRLLSKLIHLSMEYQNMARISKLIITFVYVAHFFGCMFFFVGAANDCAQKAKDAAIAGNYTVNPDDVNCEWTTANGMVGEPIETQYITSLYWAMMTVTTVGYGDISVTSVQEKSFATVVMIFANLMGAVIFGNVTTLIQNLSAAENRHSSRTEMIEELIETHKIESELADRMRATVEYQWELTRCFDMDLVLSYMPQSLRVDVLMYVHKQLIMKVPFFQDCDDAFIKTVVYRLKSEIALEGDTLFEQGDAANEMYFLRRGEVAVVAPNSEEILVKLADGSYFGEIGVLVDHGKRMFSIKALKKCEYYMLTKDDLDWVTEKFPEYRDVLRLAAMERLEKSNNVLKNSKIGTLTQGRILVEVRNVTGAGPGVDKFCKVSIKDHEQRSSILGPNSPAENFDLNSIFNFHFEMKAPEKIEDLSLKIQLMHNRTLLGEHVVGTGLVALTNIKRGEYNDRWLTVGKGHNGPDMKMYVRVLVHEDHKNGTDADAGRSGIMATLANDKDAEYDDFDLPGKNDRSRATSLESLGGSSLEDRIASLEQNITSLTGVLASITASVSRIESSLVSSGAN